MICKFHMAVHLDASDDKYLLSQSTNQQLIKTGLRFAYQTVIIKLFLLDCNYQNQSSKPSFQPTVISLSTGKTWRLLSLIILYRVR